MPGEDDRRIWEQLGRVAGLVENLTKNWGEKDRQATEGREELRDKFDDLKDHVTNSVNDLKSQLARVIVDVSILTSDVTRMRPSIERIEITRHRNAGAKYVLGVIWAALLAGVSAIAYVIHDWVGLLWPPKH
jgi:hypothetical protein